MAADIAALRKRRTALKGWMARGQKSIEDLCKQKDCDMFDLKAAVDAYEGRLQTYKLVQAQIEEKLEEADMLKEIDVEAFWEVKCQKTIAAGHKRLAALSESVKKTDQHSVNPSAGTTVAGKEYLAMPKVTISNFSGNLLEYLPFIQCFESAVDRANLPNHLKLSILRSHLRGEALSTIALFADTDENYQPALDAIKLRYGDTNRLVDVYVEQLLMLRDTAAKLTLRQLHDKLRSVIHILDTLGVSSKQYAILLVPMLKAVFPHDLKMEWGKYELEHASQFVDDRLGGILAFLENRVKILEFADGSKVSKLDIWQEPSNDQKKPVKENFKLSGTANFNAKVKTSEPASTRRPGTNSGWNAPPCPFCGSGHHPASCNAKNDMSPLQVLGLIEETRRCKMCLGAHSTEKCRFANPCAICGGGHHPSICLHRQKVTRPLQYNAQSQVCSPSTSTLATNPRVIVSVPPPRILEQTATVRVSTTCMSTSIIGRCLLDTGSQRSYVTRSVCLSLQPQVVRTDVINSFSFGGNSTGHKPTAVVELTLSSRHGGRSINVQALVTDCISAAPFDPLPLDILNLPHLQDLVLADEPGLGPTNVDILIGLDAYYSIVGSNIRRGTVDEPIAVSSLFGWILAGPGGPQPGSSVSVQCQINRTFSLAKLDSTLQQFWDLESVGILAEETTLTEDRIAYRLFLDSVRFTGTRYSTELPWRLEHPPLLSNHTQATSRLRRLERSLSGEGKTMYDCALQEFVDEGYVEPAPTQLTGPKEFYLPHRPVKKQSSNTYKIRPVYDASAAGPNGVSLNQCLYVGPSLVPDLINVLLRFRQWEIGLIGDLKRAFLQIEVEPRDRDVLRYIWNDEVLRFTRVPFGVSSSPFLLSAVIRHHLDLYQNRVPEVTELVTDMSQNFYVDDYASGSVSMESALEKAVSATQIMNTAGMTLRNWASNSPAVLENLGSLNIQTQPDQICTVLGLVWDTHADTLSIQSHTANTGEPRASSTPYTKRSLLSIISKAYDPLGWCAPVVIRGKILMQNLWKSGIAWDEVITDPDLLLEAFLVESELADLSKIVLPRWMNIDESTPFDLHVFCDASLDAYSCVIYVASDTQSQFLIAKTRVAPLNPPQTLPRYELLGCLIGARLVSHVKREVPLLKYANVLCWSDSTIALQWLQSDDHKDVFVSNRSREIRRRSETYRWGHVPSAENAADLATRPNMTVDVLIGNGLWWNGPEWLMDSARYPPSASVASTDTETVDGLLVHDLVVGQRKPNKPAEVQSPVFELRLGRLATSLRAVAYAMRFVARIRRNVGRTDDYDLRELDPGDGNLKLKSGLEIPTPSHDEIERARIVWVKDVQRISFSTEIEAMTREDQCLQKDSPLWELKPRFDDHGLLRSEGRAHRVHADSRNPLILPGNTKYTDLLIQDVHESLFHVGGTATLCELCQTVWIMQPRRNIRRVLSQCGVCRRHKAKPYTTTSSALPQWRLGERPPFSAIGIDFAGPFQLTEGKGSVLLITCCVTRAVHLEVTADQSYKSVLNALRRLVARRGPVEIIASDNAKSFRRAKSLLNTVKWINIPERAPWWGGFWERLVQNVKKALKHGLGRLKLDFETFRTLIPEIEYAVNRRPITYFSLAPEDPLPIRPIDFLISPGSSSTDLTVHENLTKRYKMRQSVLESIWSRFRKEYLPSLHQWKKFTTGGRRPKVGDVVLLDPQRITNKAFFPLGMITELIVGKDGEIRAVYVKSNGFIFRRSVTMLYPLEVDPQEKTPDIDIIIDGDAAHADEPKRRLGTDMVAETVERESTEVLSGVNDELAGLVEDTMNFGNEDSAEVPLTPNETDIQPRVTRKGRQLKTPLRLLD